MFIPFTRSNDGTLVFGMTSTGAIIPPVAPTHPKYDQVREALASGDEDALVRLTAPTKAVEVWSEGQIVVDRMTRGATLNGEPLHHVVVDKAFQHMDANLPYEHLLRFLERLQKNPSRRAVMELYGFIEHVGIAITEKGTCVGYKRVRQADAAGRHFDHYSGRFEYAIGKEARVPRNSVDDNPDNDCSHGLHIGSLSYVQGFHSGSPVMVVEFAPEDVVSVPRHDTTKLRVCALTPLKFVDEKDLGIALSAPCYRAEIGSVTPTPARDAYAPADEDADGNADVQAYAGEIPPPYVLMLAPGSGPADWRKVNGAWVHKDAELDDAEFDDYVPGTYRGFAFCPGAPFVDADDYEDYADPASPLYAVVGPEGTTPVCYDRADDNIKVGCQKYSYRTWMTPEFQAAKAQEFSADSDEISFYQRALLALAAANGLK